MRTRVVIQSRLSSSRLPGKALMTVAGMPLIELVARRASRSGFEVVVATSVEAYDDRIAQHLERVGIRVVRGGLDDVLGRFVLATADLYDEDRVIRLTGDNPVTDASLVQEMLDEMAGTGFDYGRVDIDHAPEGLGAEAFSVASLRRADAEATAAYDREHVTPWIRRTLGEYLFVPRAAYADPVIYRCTTDCLHDYDRVSRLFDGVADPVGVSWREIFARLHTMISGFGALAVASGRRGRITTVLLGAASLRNVGGEVLRDTFAAAVDRGVSHAFVGPGLARTVALGTLPGLRQRLGTMLVLSGAADARAELEESFAHLQGRGAAAVFDPSTEAGPAWDALLGYVEEGVVGALGVMAPSVAAVPGAARPGQSMLAVPVGPEDGDLSRLRVAAEGGLVVIAVLRSHDPVLVGRLLASGHVHAVAVQPASVTELAESLGAAV